MIELHINGMGRDPGNPRTLVVYLNRPATDDELRELHERIRPPAKPAAKEGWDKTQAGPWCDIRQGDPTPHGPADAYDVYAATARDRAGD